MRSATLKRAASVGVLSASLLIVPLAAITYYRLFEIRAHAQRWAELTQASLWLGTGISCGGADSASLAREDLVRWREGVSRLRKEGAAWFSSPGLIERIDSLEQELAAVLAQPESGYATWTRAHCDELSRLSARAVEESVRLGVDPASRDYRAEDLAVRDVTTYLLVWLVLVALIYMWTRRGVVEPVARLGRVVRRIADGDLSADVPIPDDESMRELAVAVREAVDKFEQRDVLKTQRVLEVRDLVRRLIELVEQPVLVVALDHTIDYANQAAAKAFDEKLTNLEGAELLRLPGGQEVRAAMDDVLGRGETHHDRIVATNPLRQQQHLARCAVVRDHAGTPTRVVIVMKNAESGWWKKLWKVGEKETIEPA